MDLDPIHHYQDIIYTGCGSTYYLSLAAAALTQELTGLPCRAFPSSELWLYPKSSYSSANTLLVATSRSGETTETLRACQSFVEQKRGDLITLSCYPEMPLAKMGALNIILPSGQEKSVAQTRAFSTLYLGATALACLWAGCEDLYTSLSCLPEVGNRLLSTYSSYATELGMNSSLDRFYWLGSGSRFGLACELSLKMKEMTITHSEPFHFLEFRHGPMSMVNKHTVVVGLLSRSNYTYKSKVLSEMEALGATILSLGESGAKVAFESGIPEPANGVLYLPLLQWMAFNRSVSKGLNPDHPNDLTAVIQLS